MSINLIHFFSKGKAEPLKPPALAPTGGGTASPFKPTAVTAATAKESFAFGNADAVKTEEPTEPSKPGFGFATASSPGFGFATKAAAATIEAPDFVKSTTDSVIKLTAGAVQAVKVRSKVYHRMTRFMDIGYHG